MIKKYQMLSDPPRVLLPEYERVPRIYTQLGPWTETGRMRSGGQRRGFEWWPEKMTNLQNLPKKTARLDPLYNVRQCIVADPGCVLIAADLQQAELYAYLAYSGDIRKLARLGAGEDLHSEIAAAIYGIPLSDVDRKTHRVVGKFANYSLGYGGGERMFLGKVNKDADLTGVSISAKLAKTAVETWRRMNPKVVRWWRETENAVRKHGYLVNAFGRKRVFLKQNPNEIIAFLPQSTIADHLNGALARVYERFDPWLLQVMLQVHDEILVQVPEAKAEQAAKALRSEMEQPLYINAIKLNIPVDVSFGVNWGEMK
jgi:DNA polymerase-1